MCIRELLVVQPYEQPLLLFLHNFEQLIFYILYNLFLDTQHLNIKI